MKTPEELYEENYKGFSATSVENAHSKGFMLGHKVTAEEYRAKVFKIVDACFHAYASSYRNEAKEMVGEILDT